jgi:Ser/Thr protein kinase RdoA (MazF antagonist)
MTRACAAGLDFVPKLCSTPAHATWVEHQGRLWDLTSWMPGRADFTTHPSVLRLEHACTALARLHGVWLSGTARVPCPAVERRLQRWQAWRDLLATGWHPATEVAHPLHALVVRSWNLLPPLMQNIPRQLAPWLDCRLPIQPCLCDIWHDHVLFLGDEVTGIIDYGSAQLDHVAVDLARMLGSLVGDDSAMIAAGLRAYREVRGVSQADEELMRVLDVTGAVIGAANWLMWLELERRPMENLEAAARRWNTLLTRIERWPLAA